MEKETVRGFSKPSTIVIVGTDKREYLKEYCESFFEAKHHPQIFDAVAKADDELVEEMYAEFGELETTLEQIWYSLVGDEDDWSK